MFGTIFQNDDEESDSSGTVYNVDITDDVNVTDERFSVLAAPPPPPSRLAF